MAKWRRMTCDSSLGDGSPTTANVLWGHHQTPDLYASPMKQLFVLWLFLIKQMSDRCPLPSTKVRSWVIPDQAHAFVHLPPTMDRSLVILHQADVQSLFISHQANAWSLSIFHETIDSVTASVCFEQFRRVPRFRAWGGAALARNLRTPLNCLKQTHLGRRRPGSKS